MLFFVGLPIPIANIQVHRWVFDFGTDLKTASWLFAFTMVEKLVAIEEASSYRLRDRCDDEKMRCY